MANNEPKKGGILRAYLNFNVLYKILIGLVIGAVAGIILAATGVTALPKWISMFGTIFTRLLKMIITWARSVSAWSSSTWSPLLSASSSAS